MKYKNSYFNSFFLLCLITTINSSEIKQDYNFDTYEENITEKDIIEDLLKIHSEANEDFITSISTSELLSEIDQQLESDSNNFNTIYFNTRNNCQRLESTTSNFLIEIKDYISAQEINLANDQADLINSRANFENNKAIFDSETSELQFITQKHNKEEEQFEAKQNEIKDKLSVIDECLNLINVNLLSNDPLSNNFASFIELKNNLNIKLNSLAKLMGNTLDTSLITNMIKAQPHSDKKLIENMLQVLKDLKNKVKENYIDFKSSFEKMKINASNILQAKTEYIIKVKESLSKSEQRISSLNERVSKAKDFLMQFKLIYKKYDEEKQIEKNNCDKILGMLKEKKEHLEVNKEYMTITLSNQN